MEKGWLPDWHQNTLLWVPRVPGLEGSEDIQGSTPGGPKRSNFEDPSLPFSLPPPFPAVGSFSYGPFRTQDYCSTSLGVRVAGLGSLTGVTGGSARQEFRSQGSERSSGPSL